MVELIPKHARKEIPWQRISLYFAVGLLALVLLVSGLLFYFENKSQSELQRLEEEVAQVGTSAEKQLERDVLGTKKRISDFAKIFEAHQRPSRLFSLLEENCHPKVWFSLFELNMENRQVQLTGHTLNFRTLGEQLAILRQQEMIEEVSLTDLSIGEEGQTDFSLSLVISPEIFK